jgi:glycosyltransferase involved in cell wall biosynthesis
MGMKLSVVLATYNEEDNLGACLEAVKDLADEIVVVDGESRDQTRQIAASYGARIYKTTNKPIFHLNKQMAVDRAKGEWVLQLDADERVSPQLAEEIKKIVCGAPGPEGEKAAYWIKRKNLFLGKFLTKGGVYPDPVIRLFKKGKAHLPCRSVHEQFAVEGPVGWLENDLIHLADPSFSRYLRRHNRYTTLMAREMAAAGQSLGIIPFLSYFIVKPFYWFLKVFLRHKGFRDGFPGFVFALFSGLRFPVAYVKYWEMSTAGWSEKELERDWE